MNPAEIRTIQPADNKALATIVRDSLAEFGANKPGTVFYDPLLTIYLSYFKPKVQSISFW
jgi:hypothetical protein